MMPLEDKKNETVEKDTSPLKTEEIINILNKTDSTFLKSNEITGNIKSDFKAFSIKGRDFLKSSMCVPFFSP